MKNKNAARSLGHNRWSDSGSKPKGKPDAEPPLSPLQAALSVFADRFLNACNCGGTTVVDLFGEGRFGAAAHNDEEKEEDIERRFSDRDTKYLLTKWKDLPPDVQTACEKLGYTPSMWDASVPFDNTYKTLWVELREDERTSIELLGWNPTSWENQYRKINWKDLPDLQKEAAGALGLTQATWERYDRLDYLKGHAQWDFLDANQREALCVLGWTRLKWNEEVFRSKLLTKTAADF